MILLFCYPLYIQTSSASLMPAKMHAFVALGETDMKILCKAYTEIWDILKNFMDKTWILCHVIFILSMRCGTQHFLKIC